MRASLLILSVACLVAYFAAEDPAFISVRSAATFLPTALREAIFRSALPPYALLDVFASEAMDWEKSTTAIPISRSSVLLKGVLSRQADALPSQLRHLADKATVKVQDVRDYLNTHRLASLKHLCSGAKRVECAAQVNTADPELGLTPLHLAFATGDKEAVSWLIDLGGNTDALDSAGRKPANLSFASFVKNSKRFAAEAGRKSCHLPTVEIRSQLDFAEVRRLVSEGEPVLIKNALNFLNSGDMLRDFNLEELVARYGNARVNVGEVPYADYFALPSNVSTLSDFYRQHVLRPSEAPLYIFQKHTSITEAGLRVLGELVDSALPVGSIVCPLTYKNTGQESIHFFLGCASSGAPFHIHADALNVITMGKKQWWLYPPTQALYSRKHIAQWVKEDLASMPEDEKPLSCVQEAGDVIYVPFDWGHATMNKELTFGYALELFNRRELFVTLPSHHQAC